jgi:hypothetical protein
MFISAVFFLLELSSQGPQVGSRPGSLAMCRNIPLPAGQGSVICLGFPGLGTEFPSCRPEERLEILSCEIIALAEHLQLPDCRWQEGNAGMGHFSPARGAQGGAVT